MIDGNITYYAFISYKHAQKDGSFAKDAKWAEKIHEYLTKWNIPSAIDSNQLIKEDDQQIKPVFRDEVEIHAGDELEKILNDTLDKSKTLVVICSKAMIADQVDKQKNNRKKNNKDKAYVFEEIEYFKNELKRPIILVWIDKEPYNKNSPLCVPPQFKGTDVKVVEANAYRKTLFSQVKRRTTAEIAASIFQTNMGAFWDVYRRKMIVVYSTSLALLVVLGGIIWFLWTNNQRNEAYKNISQANEYIMQGNRFEAMKLAKEAYESYSNAEGLSVLMGKCLDKAIPFKSYNSLVYVSPDGSIFTTIVKNRFVEINDANSDSVLQVIDATHVDKTAISRDNNMIVCISTLDSIRVFNRSLNKFVTSIGHNFIEDIDAAINSDGTKIVTLNDLNIFEIDKLNNPYYSPLNYHTNIDSLIWKNAKGTFLKNDSLLVVYGGETKSSNYHNFKIPQDEIKKSCKVYSLDHKEKNIYYTPAILFEIEIPENTTCISASEKSNCVIVATSNNIIVHTFNNGTHNTKVVGYSNYYSSCSGDLFEVYKSLYPDWNKINIVDIIFSDNGEYAILVADNNIRYIVSINSYRYFLSNNALKLEEDQDPRYTRKEEYNKQDVAIGITNNGKVVTYDPFSNSNKNIFIAGNTALNNLFKPVYEFDKNKFEFYENSNYIFILEKYKKYDYSKYESTVKAKSYIYKKNNFVQDKLYHFRNSTDTTVTAISPMEKYAILSIPAPKDTRSSIIWDIANNKCVLNVADVLKEINHDRGCSAKFIGNDELVEIEYFVEKTFRTWRSESMIYNIENKSIVAKKGEGSVLSDNAVLVTHNDSTAVINFKTNEEIIKLNNRFELQLDSYAGRDVVLLRKNSFDLVLCNVKTNTITHIPDSLKANSGSEVRITPNGERIIINSSFPLISSILIRKTDDFKIQYKLPVYVQKHKSLMYFTPDSKYLIYNKKDMSDLTLFDLKQGKEVYTLDLFLNTEKPTTMYYSAGFKNPYRGFACSNNYMAIKSNNIQVIEIKTGKTVAEFDLSFSNEYPNLYFTPNGEYLIADEYLIDVKKMKRVRSDIPVDPVYINNDAIIYKDFVYPLMDVKQMYKAIKEILKKYNK